MRRRRRRREKTEGGREKPAQRDGLRLVTFFATVTAADTGERWEGGRERGESRGEEGTEDGAKEESN